LEGSFWRNFLRAIARLSVVIPCSDANSGSIPWEGGASGGSESQIVAVFAESDADKHDSTGH